MRIPLNLYPLSLFSAVVQHGGVSRAASHLRMTQPALSMQIKSLERRLGVPLFLRQGNKFELTEFGEIAYTYAQKLLSLEQQLVDALTELGTGAAGHIQIGSNRPFGRYLLPLYMVPFMEAHPQVRFTVTYDNTDTICQAVVDEAVDVGLVTWSAHDMLAPSLTFRRLRQDHWCLVAAATSPWALTSHSGRTVLGQAPLITGLLDSPHGKMIHQHLARLGFMESHYFVRMRLGDLESIKWAVLANLGVAFLPHSTIAQELHGRLLVELDLEDSPPLILDFALILKKQRYLPPTVAGFLDFVEPLSEEPPSGT